jgi:hypothetical protein
VLSWCEACRNRTRAITPAERARVRRLPTPGERMVEWRCRPGQQSFAEFWSPADSLLPVAEWWEHWMRAADLAEVGRFGGLNAPVTSVSYTPQTQFGPSSHVTR